MHYGCPANPEVPSQIPGGSSSGSAVAVAAGIVDFTLGICWFWFPCLRLKTIEAHQLYFLIDKIIQLDVINIAILTGHLELQLYCLLGNFMDSFPSVFFSWMLLHMLITDLIGSDSILILTSYEASENSIYPQCLVWVPFVLHFDSLCKVYFFTSSRLSSDAMHDHQTMNLFSQWKLFNTRNPQSCSFTMQSWMAERDCNYKKGCCDSNFGAGSSCRQKTREISHQISQGRRSVANENS